MIKLLLTSLVSSVLNQGVITPYMEINNSELTVNNKCSQNNSETFNFYGNYTYHSGWTNVDYNDSPILKSMYEKINLLFNLKAQNVSIKNFNVFLVDNKNKINISGGNFGTVENDLENYAAGNKQDNDFYSSFTLDGHEHYSWNWAKAKPNYTWYFNYKGWGDIKSSNILTHERSGYYESEYRIMYSFEVDYNIWN